MIDDDVSKRGVQSNHTDVFFLGYVRVSVFTCVPLETISIEMIFLSLRKKQHQVIA